MSCRFRLYVGCYTEEGSNAIHGYDVRDVDGHLGAVADVELVEHASFVTVHPNGCVLYAVSEYSNRDGAVHAFAIEPVSGSLALVDTIPSGGGQPCHLSVDPGGRFLYAANYGSGTVLVRELDEEGGFAPLSSVGQHAGRGPTARQDGPHTHCVLPDPTGENVYAVDLGIDRIVRYVHRPAGSVWGLAPAHELELRPGSGPRHLTFHPTEPLAFLIGELDSTISTLGVEPRSGNLTLLSTQSTLPNGANSASLGADVRVHPNGRFVYASNRGDDSIAVFELSAERQMLELLAHVPSGGRFPRALALHPSGRSLLVANQLSNCVASFSIDPETGTLEQSHTISGISQPASLAFCEAPR